MDLFDLTGRTALVTGSSRGIGHALALGLLEAGARVVVHGRDGEAAEAAASRLRQATGGEVLVETLETLRRRVRSGYLRAQPRLAVCGHIHACWTEESIVGETRVINAGPGGVWAELEVV